MVTVEAVDAVTDEIVEALERLLPQLSSLSRPVDSEYLAAIVGSPATRLLVARDDAGVIAGSLTLAVFRIPTGIRAWIEDVVVDERRRGRGIGEALTRRAIRLARDAGARTIELTSRPSREAANRLYERVGFVRRETNVYRFELPDD